MNVANYEFKTLLGEGGMGQVWRAVDERLRRDVAVKVLPQETASDPLFRARFLREARLAARLNHPHIATIFSVEEHGSTLYLVMELVEGTPLDRIIAKGPMAPAEAIDIMLQTASAIEEAHAQGIIHRDLKPENIMISERGVKVLDFGVAREIVPTGGSSMTQAGVVLGTPHYMSPEQAQALPLDAQTDIFSLGTVFYEMLSGRKPFEGAGFMDVLLHIVTEPHAPLQNVPPKLAAVVDRCLQKNPAARFRSAEELMAALSAVAPSDDAVRPRALVADDDAVTRCLLSAALEGMGYDVDEAVDGSDAISRLKSGRYALFITDLLMPRLDGWNVLDFLRGAAARRPELIFVTSMMRDVKLGEADRRMVRGVIVKPITAAQLKVALAHEG